MLELNESLVYAVGAFIGSVVVSYITFRIIKSKKLPVPKQNAILRVSSSGSMYRSQFIGERPDGWAITSPLQRDSYVPVKEGDYIIMETVVPKGVAVYKTTILKRANNPPMIIVQKPTLWHVEDRRDAIRIEDIGHLPAKLDGDKVGLLDMSACGARIRSQARRSEGDRVKLEVNGFPDGIYGWVLDSSRKGDRYILRLRFEEETDLSALVGA